MIPDRRLVRAGQKAEAIADIPFIDGVNEVDGRRRYQADDDESGNELRHPLDDDGVPPDGDVLVGEESWNLLRHSDTAGAGVRGSRSSRQIVHHRPAIGKLPPRPAVCAPAYRNGAA